MNTCEFTPSQLRDIALAKEAHERGEPVEWAAAERRTLVWNVFDHREFMNGNLYRPAPAPPQPVPWSDASHVPINCWVENYADPNRVSMVIAISAEGIYLVANRNGDIRLVEWKELENLRYSTDRQQWHKCEVLP